MELVHKGFLTIESGKADKDVNTIVVTDHLTMYAQAFVTPIQIARVVAQTLWDKFIVHYDLPEQTLNDQSTNIKSNLIVELCKVSKIKKFRTSPYRPQTNSQCEWFNATLISMLGTLPSVAKKMARPCIYIGICLQLHSLQCNRAHTSLCVEDIWCYPSILSLVFRPQIFWHPPHSYMCKNCKTDFNGPIKQQQEVSKKECERSKRHFDNKIRCVKLEPGDMVLVHQKAFNGKTQKSGQIGKCSL